MQVWKKIRNRVLTLSMFSLVLTQCHTQEFFDNEPSYSKASVSISWNAPAGIESAEEAMLLNYDPLLPESTLPSHTILNPQAMLKVELSDFTGFFQIGDFSLTVEGTLASPRLDSPRLDSIALNSTNLNSTSLNSTNLNSTGLFSATRPLTLSEVRVQKKGKPAWQSLPSLEKELTEADFICFLCQEVVSPDNTIGSLQSGVFFIPLQFPDGWTWIADSTIRILFFSKWQEAPLVESTILVEKNATLTSRSEPLA